MMLYQEKISPPLAPLSEEEQMKLTIASKDRWAKGLIARIFEISNNTKLRLEVASVGGLEA
jgi:hypothetical protein